MWRGLEMLGEASDGTLGQGLGWRVFGVGEKSLSVSWAYELLPCAEAEALREQQS